MRVLDQLVRIAELECAAFVIGAQAIEPKRRLFLSDGSFVNVWASTKLPGRFGFHWQRLDGRIYRYDNYPDPARYAVATFPHHFHDGPETTAVASPFPLEPLDGFRAFLAFVSLHLHM